MVVRCDCAMEKTVLFERLRSGFTQSCGSFACARDHTGQRPDRGRRFTGALYRRWMKIKERCFDPKHNRFRHYGGRGIRMWSGWAESFECFEQDILTTIGDWPGPGLTLDRIDNDGGYVPGNLRWATRSEQNRNQRRSRNREALVCGCV